MPPGIGLVSVPNRDGIEITTGGRFGRLRKCAKRMELARGIEPPTCGLQNHCSAVELRQHWNPLSITVITHQPLRLEAK